MRPMRLAKPCYSFPSSVHICSKSKASEWDAVEQTPHVASKWDATPGPAAMDASRWDATPGHDGGLAGPTPKRNRWDEATPERVSKQKISVKTSCHTSRLLATMVIAWSNFKRMIVSQIDPVQGEIGATPAWQGETPSDGMAAAVPKKPRSRWDETPANLGPSATPSVASGQMGVTPGFFTGATPATGFAGMETPATAMRAAAMGQQVRNVSPRPYSCRKTPTLTP